MDTVQPNLSKKLTLLVKYLDVNITLQWNILWITFEKSPQKIYQENIWQSNSTQNRCLSFWCHQWNMNTSRKWLEIKFWKGIMPGAGEAFHSWQRSWGRRLGIRKGGIEPQESARIFSSIYPPKKPESAYFIALCSHLWLYWGLSPTTISLSLSKS